MGTIIKSRIRLTLEVSQETFACLHDLASTGLFGTGGGPEVAARFIDERIQHYVREGWLPSRDFVPRGKTVMARRR